MKYLVPEAHIELSGIFKVEYNFKLSGIVVLNDGASHIVLILGANKARKIAQISSFQSFRRALCQHKYFRNTMR